MYDNTVSARTYLSYIAEQAGGIAVIGRDGKLYIKTIGESSVTLPLKLFKTFKWGEKFKITRVRYDDGIQLFEKGDTTGNTVYISQDNMYIVDQDQINNIYNTLKGLEFYSFEGESIIDPALDTGDIVVIDGKNVIYQGSMQFSGRWIANIESKIQCKAKEETTTRTPSQRTINRRVESNINQIDGKITQLTEETTENTQKITKVEQDVNGITSKVSSVEQSVENITKIEGTAEGKNIYIDDASAEPLIDIMLEGESQQATRSGKNLLDNTATTKISNGITFTVNSDGTVLVDGTNDTSANSSLVINRYDLSPGTYILNGCPSGGASNTYRLAIQETGSYSILGSIDIGNGSREFTIDTTTSVQIAIFIQKGLTINNLLFKPMLREATIADDTYEQYGASPSPDYRSKIENLEGENICPSLNTTRTINGVTFTKNKDGSITMNGTATAEANYPINVNTTTNTRTVLLKANSKYRMLSNYESGKYTTQVFYLKNNATTYASSLIETVEETKAGMYIRVYKDAVLENVTIYPQITKGEEYKPYVPYNSLEFKDVGSNVLELSKGTVTLNGVTLTSDGETITINGTVSGNYPAVKLTNGLKAATSLETLVNNYISERVAQLEDIKDCTIQSIISGGSSTFTPYIGSYNKTVRELWYGIGTPAKTIQTSSTSLIAIYLGGKGSTYNNYKIKIGINKGTVAKAYEPYKQQTECFPLSEGQKLYKNSYLADDGIHHKRNQVVLDGSDDEGWTLFNSKKNSYKLSNFINGNGNDNSLIILFYQIILNRIRKRMYLKV